MSLSPFSTFKARESSSSAAKDNSPSQRKMMLTKVKKIIFWNGFLWIVMGVGLKKELSCEKNGYRPE
jgi:hypothetical protein